MSNVRPDPKDVLKMYSVNMSMPKMSQVMTSLMEVEISLECNGEK
jgi:hypothetical protein